MENRVVSINRMLVKKAKLQSVENNAAVASGKISSLERKNWSSKKKKKNWMNENYFGKHSPPPLTREMDSNNRDTIISGLKIQ